MTDEQCWYCEQFSWHEWALLNKTAQKVLKTDSRISCSKARYIHTTSWPGWKPQLLRVMFWWVPLQVTYRSKHVRKLRKINDTLMRYLISVS